MDLKSAANALGGDVYRGRVLCPGPGHRPGDRSLCVWLDGDNLRVHSFANNDWKECKDYVRERLNLPHDFSPARDMPICRNADSDTEKLGAARRSMAMQLPTTPLLVSTYLREARGYEGPLPPSIRFLPPERYPQPAMIAAFGIGEVRGIHLTFLKEDGSGKADIDRPKIMMGPSAGWPIVVAEPNDLLALAITEGIEDALSISSNRGRRLGCWFRKSDAAAG